MNSNVGVPELVKWAALKRQWLSACAGSSPVTHIHSNNLETDNPFCARYIASAKTGETSITSIPFCPW